MTTRPESSSSANEIPVASPESPSTNVAPATPGTTGPEIGSIFIFLMIAGFAVALNIRITDPLLPTLSAEFSSTPGKVSIVTVCYAVAHGLMQFGGGPLGDRFGKLRVLTLLGFAAAAVTAASALAESVFELGVYRFLSGATAAIMFPLAMAYIGDEVPYEKRQVMLARMLGAAMMGTMLGQAVSGIIADFLGWRAVFLIVGGMFAVGACGLVFARGLSKSVVLRTEESGIFSDLVKPIRLLRRPPVRLVLGVTAAQGFLVMGATTFLGAYLHDEYNLSYSQIGLVLAAFGAGGVLYTICAGWLIPRLGERRMVTIGGLLFSIFFAAVAFAPIWQLIPVFLFLSGATLLMLHNTLQLKASQMAPEERGTAMSSFAASFFFGNLAGVAVVGPIYDRVGGAPVIVAAAVLFAIVALIFRAHLGPKDAHA
jgi:YNFM family putative membrane transporter